MASEGELSVPIIDFSKSKLKLGTPNPKWDFVRSQVMKAGEEYGCFIALFDELTLDAQKGMENELKDLFDLPVDTKSQNVYKRPYHGYFGQLPHAPLFESLGVGNPRSLDNINSFVDMIWPEGRPNFSKTVRSFTKPLLELESMVKKMVLESLGVEKYLDELEGSASYNLRVMKYNAPQGFETDQLGLTAHLDKNVITILYQIRGDGLEVEGKYGEWIKINAFPGSAVVVFGETFEAWTNGHLKAAYHRVMMTGNNPRYSAGIFSAFREDFVVKAPEELVDEERPLLFKPYIYEELMKQLQTEEVRMRSRYCLDAYRNV